MAYVVILSAAIVIMLAIELTPAGISADTRDLLAGIAGFAVFAAGLVAASVGFAYLLKSIGVL